MCVCVPFACVCVCHAPNLGAVPHQRGDSHLEGGYPGHRAAALFREAWDVTRPRRVEKRGHRGPCPRGPRAPGGVAEAGGGT